MKITKEASTFYSLIALLKVCSRFIDYLTASSEVARALKYDLTILNNKIRYLNRICDKSLEGSERKQWQAEWTERDFEVYSSILFSLNDMNEQQRLVAEEFMGQLAKGCVRVEEDKIINA